MVYVRGGVYFIKQMRVVTKNVPVMPTHIGEFTCGNVSGTCDGRVDNEVDITLPLMK